VSEGPAAELAGARWFGGKGREIVRTALVDQLVLEPDAVLALVEAELDGGETQRYTLLPPSQPDRGFFGPLLERMVHGPLAGSHGVFELRAATPWRAPGPSERPIGIDQSNTSLVLGERLLVKCYRRLWPGTHPEVELVSFLSGRFPGVPAAAGSLHYVAGSGEEYALALVQEYVPNAEDGWEWCQQLVRDTAGGAPIDPSWASELGALVAELHAALAGLGKHAPAPGDLARRRRRAEGELAQVRGLLDPALAGRAATELAGFERGTSPMLTRIHGDLHVGQVLRSPAGYRLIDFEGEPTRPLQERHAADVPLRDVASLLRSLDHVPLWAFREPPDSLAQGRAWSDACRAGFLAGYAPSLDRALLRALEVEKAIYEFAYAEAFLPEWRPIAERGLEWLLSRDLAE
jgi:maltokinase